MSNISSKKEVLKPDTTDRIRIGGMALENGVLLQSNKYWSMAVRTPEGDIRIASGDKVGFNQTLALKKIPMLRGLINMAETIMVLPKVHYHGGQLPLPTRSPQLIASLIVSIAGTMMLKKPHKKISPLLEEALVSALAVMPSLVALKKTHATQYHAVEHKSINAYENHGVIDKDDALSAGADHPRCGSNIVGPALAMMALGNTFARRALGRQSHTVRMGVSVLSLSGAIELIQWSSRNPRSLLSKLFTIPGGGLQNALTTSEPTDEQLAVGLEALRELLRREGA